MTEREFLIVLGFALGDLIKYIQVYNNESSRGTVMLFHSLCNSIECPLVENVHPLCFITERYYL